MTCFYCGISATKFCREHRLYLCESESCFRYHRFIFRPELCRVVDAGLFRDWAIGWVVRIAAAFTVVAGIAIVWVHVR